MKKILKKKKLLIIIGIFVLLTIGIVLLYTHFKAKSEPVDTTTVVLGKTTYRLTKDESEYDLSYRIATNFRKTKLPKYVNYSSDDINGSPFFLIRLYRYSDKKMDYVIKDTIGKTIKKEKAEISGIKYTVVHSKYLNHKVKTYYRKQKNYIYVFSFTSDIDISQLENAFMKNIIYRIN